MKDLIPTMNCWVLMWCPAFDQSQIIGIFRSERLANNAKKSVKPDIRKECIIEAHEYQQTSKIWEGYTGVFKK